MIVKKSPDLPRSCVDHVTNGYSEDGVYTIFASITNVMRDIYCYMSAAPSTVYSPICHLSQGNGGVKFAFCPSVCLSVCLFGIQNN